MLEKVAHLNDLSPDLRKKLEDRIESYGKKVKYKFAISNENPDPEKYNGKVIWPSKYTLDPIVFKIIDNKKSVEVGMIDKTNEKGLPISFRRIRVHGKDEGNFILDLTSPDEREMAMYIE